MYIYIHTHTHTHAHTHSRWRHRPWAHVATTAHMPSIATRKHKRISAVSSTTSSQGILLVFSFFFFFSLFFLLFFGCHKHSTTSAVSSLTCSKDTLPGFPVFHFLFNLSHTVFESFISFFGHCSQTSSARCYGVATISGLLKIIGLFCKRAL